MPDCDTRTFTRRTFLLGAGAAAALTACAPRSPAPAAPEAGPPRRGGQLRVGMVGGGKAESFNPAGTAYALINIAMVQAVFDPPIRIAADLSLQPGLFTEWTPDPAATEWTFTLRPDVTWHDGKPFTAEDVIYSLRWMGTPGNRMEDTVRSVDLANVRKDGPHRVVVPLKHPYLEFPVVLAAAAFLVQDGAEDFTTPVGTGPFVFHAFEPGRQSTCRRNPDYWEEGKPYVDELVIRSLNDDTARLNALTGGEIDVMAQVPFHSAKAGLGDNVRLLRASGLGAYAFYLAVDQPPFDDVRVRQALRLLMDRQQLVDVALYGFGSVANDLFGKGLPGYAADLPQRHRDVERAKMLLREAGHGSGLKLELQTAAIAPGTVEAATLFQQQAKDAGVEVEVSQVDTAAYFDPTRNYLRMPFAQTVWSGYATLSNFYPYMLQPDAAGNETHWNSPRTTELIDQATTATTPAAAASAWAAVQREQWDEGGYLWWGTVDNLDAVSTRVAGIVPNRLGPPTGFADAYFVS
ncbi:ABC transporter substrate-binding protein [Amycolatopsis jejuensis]|uniref:ABC transporter substrate-binding protein n=1 Tax=Amycolatopsis jejuensis TaxID=330084 RepID=UPI00052564EF|nr:ABC transporter substrate-binding protein [Amycolatopsis jejuensis]